MELFIETKDWIYFKGGGAFEAFVVPKNWVTSPMSYKADLEQNWLFVADDTSCKSHKRRLKKHNLKRAYNLENSNEIQIAYNSQNVFKCTSKKAYIEENKK